MEHAVPLKDVFTITEYGEGEKNKKQFTRIGIGFVNKDGSINVILDALPTNGRIHVRDRIARSGLKSKPNNSTT